MILFGKRGNNLNSLKFRAVSKTMLLAFTNLCVPLIKAYFIVLNWF